MSDPQVSVSCQKICLCGNMGVLDIRIQAGAKVGNKGINEGKFVEYLLYRET